MSFEILIFVWFLAALAAGVAGLPARLHPPLPQIVLVVLTAGLLLAGRLWERFRAWLRDLDWRLLVALHLSRFVGFYFLWLHRHGQLPYEFAVPAGVGDIAVAVLAVALLIARASIPQRPWLLVGWNVLGLADILMVVTGAARLGLADPSSMAPLLRLPLSLLPTFLVPIIIASHFVLFGKARAMMWRFASKTSLQQ